MSRCHRAGGEPRDPGDGGPLTATDLDQRFFRHEFGRLVAALSRRVGVRHLERVEDAVQSALLAAVTAWPDRPPDDPGAWLYSVASNRLVQDLRRESGRQRILAAHAGDLAPALDGAPYARLAGEIDDDLLRMLFVCCDDIIPAESQLVLALKTLCGFGTAEIALRLFTSEANVHKRLARARDRLREAPPELETPTLDVLRARLPAVHAVLYLIFNEGHLSAHAEHAIRRELCDEAIRLATLLGEHAVGAVPEGFALLALMHLHAARLGSRVDATGGLLLLEEQDRSLWDRERIRTGMVWLARSSEGETFSRFHAEAGIAAEHALAPSFEETRWAEIVDLYRMLEAAAPSPFHSLNKAVAIAEWLGAEAGLSSLEGLAAPAWLAGSYLWDAVLSDLHRRAGHAETAREHRERALGSAPTAAVREVLERRLGGSPRRTVS